MQVTIDLPPHVVTWLQYQAEASAKDYAAADRARGIEPAPEEPNSIEQEATLQLVRGFQAALARGYKPADDAEEIPF